MTHNDSVKGDRPTRQKESSVVGIEMMINGRRKSTCNGVVYRQKRRGPSIVRCLAELLKREM